MRIFLIITLLIFSLNAKSLFSNNEQAENSKYIGALKNLLISTQKTRGLSNSYLNGNIEAMLLVYGHRDEMKDAISDMETMPLATDPIIHKRASSISNALIKLNRKALKREPTIVFEEYTEQIQQILLLSQTVSKRGAKDLNPLGRELLNVMMQTNLPLCEYTGQLRGMGAGIAAKGTITQEQKAKMFVMINKITKLSANLTNTIRDIAANNKEDCNTLVNKKLDLITKKVSAYLKLAKKELLKSDNITYNSDEFFEKGTDLISLYIDVFEMNNKSMIKNSQGWF